MNAFEGMQPALAHLVPIGPELINTKFSVLFLTRRKAERPALPAPITATSTLISAPLSIWLIMCWLRLWLGWSDILCDANMFLIVKIKEILMETTGIVNQPCP
jgi:hypothetical protein